MRVYCLQCSELSGFEPFPEKQMNSVTLFSPEKLSTVEVFCICNMWWVCYHIKSPDLNMTECSAFHKYYHKKSENIPRGVFSKFKRSVEWHCAACK